MTASRQTRMLKQASASRSLGNGKRGAPGDGANHVEDLEHHGLGDRRVQLADIERGRGCSRQMVLGRVVRGRRRCGRGGRRQQRWGSGASNSLGCGLGDLRSGRDDGSRHDLGLGFYGVRNGVVTAYMNFLKTGGPMEQTDVSTLADKRGENRD